MNSDYAVLEKNLQKNLQAVRDDYEMKESQTELFRELEKNISNEYRKHRKRLRDLQANCPHTETMPLTVKEGIIMQCINCVKSISKSWEK